MTVYDTVDTDVTISSRWELPESVTGGTSTSVQTIDNLHHIHNTTFQPLQLQHRGNYLCIAVVRNAAPGLLQDSDVIIQKRLLIPNSNEADAQVLDCLA